MPSLHGADKITGPYGPAYGRYELLLVAQERGIAQRQDLLHVLSDLVPELRVTSDLK